MYGLQLDNRAFPVLKNQTYVIHLSNHNLSEGLRIARECCRIAAPLSNAVDFDETLPLLPAKQSVKRMIRSICLEIWNREWTSSATGSTTRLFFPTVESAASFGRVHLSREQSQVLTGHSYLNVHQHRFKFRDSPMCACGDAEKTIEHFLFSCVNVSIARRNFHASCLKEMISWPPRLSTISENPNLWTAMRVFIRETKLLSNSY